MSDLEAKCLAAERADERRGREGAPAAGRDQQTDVVKSVTEKNPENSMVPELPKETGESGGAVAEKLLQEGLSSSASSSSGANSEEEKNAKRLKLAPDAAVEDLSEEIGIVDDLPSPDREGRFSLERKTALADALPAAPPKVAVPNDLPPLDGDGQNWLSHPSRHLHRMRYTIDADPMSLANSQLPRGADAGQMGKAPARIWQRFPGTKHMGGLMVARGFGDYASQNMGHSMEPDCFELSVADVDYLICGTDGVWDMIGPGDGGYEMLCGKPSCKKLCVHAYTAYLRHTHSRSADDITAVVLSFGNEGGGTSPAGAGDEKSPQEGMGGAGSSAGSAGDAAVDADSAGL